MANRLLVDIGGMVESGKNFLLDGRGGRAGTIGDEGTVACIQTEVVRTAGLACFGLQPQLQQTYKLRLAARNSKNYR